MDFTGRFWSPFLDQPQSYVVVFEMISFEIYKTLVTEYKHLMYINYLITFNETIKICQHKLYN